MGDFKGKEAADLQLKQYKNINISQASGVKFSSMSEEHHQLYQKIQRENDYHLKMQHFNY